MELKHHLIYGISIHPGFAYFWKNEKYPKKMRKQYAYGFFVAASVLFLAYYIHHTPPNYYQRLGVSARATGGEINKAFKRVARQFHPDSKQSTNSEEDEEQFIIISKIHEKLSNPNIRAMYDRFGEKAASQPESSLYVSFAMSYVVHAVIIFIVTLGRSGSLARGYAFAGMMLLCLIDFFVKFDNLDFLQMVFPMWTPFEKMELLKEVFTIFFHGAIIYAELTFVDYESDMMKSLMILLDGQKRILDTLEAEPWKDAAGKLPNSERAEVVKEKVMKIQQTQLNKLAQQQQAKQGGGMSWGSIIFMAITLYQIIF